MSPKVRSAVFKAPMYPLKRRRTKKLHREILDQLEFYMSDSNIRHDAFMREKAGENGTKEIPIQLFLTFPLIKKMKASEKNLLKALESSTFLELSEDKKHVHRRYPITAPPHNLDNCTLYIENLPSDSTIAWLKEVCQKTGAVRHISLPRFRKSDRVKGFAFVEYASPEDVIRACRIFKDPPKNFFPIRTRHYIARLNRTQEIAAANQSPSESNVPSDASDALRNGTIFPVTEDAPPVNEKSPKNKKRKRSFDTVACQQDVHLQDSTSCSLPKKLRKSTDSRSNNLSVTSSGSVLYSKKEVQFSDTNIVRNDSVATNHASEDESQACIHLVNNTNSVISTTKPIIRRTRTLKPIKEANGPNSISISTQTVSNVGIKRRRSLSEPSNFYDSDESQLKRIKEENFEEVALESQFRPFPISDIDAVILEARHAAQVSSLHSVETGFLPNSIFKSQQEWSRRSISISPKKPTVQSVISKPIVQPKKPKRRSKTSRERKRLNAGRIPPNLNVMPKVEWMELKREYKKLQKQNMSKLKLTIRENKDAGPPSFQPGVIAKVSPMLASQNESNQHGKLPGIEEIKSVLNKYGQGVAYVDLGTDAEHGFVRFNDGESAQRAIMEEKTLALCLLTGEQEEKYWDKLLASRARKFSQERRKVRGRTKILLKAEVLVEKGKRKHIRFDDDFEESMGTN